MTATRLSPPPTRGTTRSLVSDLAHHAVYAGVGSPVYHALGRIGGAELEEAITHEERLALAA